MLNKGIEMVFIDNPTMNTEYIKSMQNSADKMKKEKLIEGMTLEFVIRLLLVTELDRAEKEHEITVKRIKDGIKASSKKSGRKEGQLDKMTPEHEADIRKFLADRSIKQIDLMNKYNISRNTLKNILSILQTKNAYDIMPIGKEIISPCGQKSESPRSCSFLGFLLILL